MGQFSYFMRGSYHHKRESFDLPVVCEDVIILQEIFLLYKQTL